MSEAEKLKIGDRLISEMKVVELKEELGKRGLSKIGNKNALHDRLKECLMEETSSSGETGKQIGTEISPQEMTSPTNPFVAEYLAKQQTALREARKDAASSEAVRHASSVEDTQPIKEKSPVVLRRSLRSHRDSDVRDVEVHKKRSRQATSSENEQDVSATSDEVDEGSGKEKAVTSEHVQKIDDVESITCLQRTEVDDNYVGSVTPPQHTEADDSYANVESTSPLESHVNDENQEEDRNEIYSEGDNTDIENEEIAAGEGIDESPELTDNTASAQYSKRDESGDVQTVDNINVKESCTLEPQQVVETADESARNSIKKIKIIDHSSKEIAVPVKKSNSPDRKRRWKSSENDGEREKVNIVRVALKEKSTDDLKIETDETSENAETPDPAPEMAYDITESKDNLEELDYEEQVQLISAAAIKDEEVVSEKSSTGRKRIEHERRSRKQDSKDGKSRIHSKSPERPVEEKRTTDGFVRSKSVSPARYPTNQVIMIRQLTRPFTVRQLQDLLSKYGEVVNGGFWIDNIKSTCLAKYSTIEEAIVARGHLHNIVWPECSPKMLKVDYSDDTSLEKRLNGAKSQSEVKRTDDKDGIHKKSTTESTSGSLKVNVFSDEQKRSTHIKENEKDEDKHVSSKKHDLESRKRKRSSSPRKSEKRPYDHWGSSWQDDRRHGNSPEAKERRLHHQVEPEKVVKKVEDLFQRTKAQPAIFYLPLTEEQILELEKRKAAAAQINKRPSETGLSKNRERDSCASKETERSIQMRSAPTSAKKESSPTAHSARRKSRSPRERRRSRTPPRRRR